MHSVPRLRSYTLDMHVCSFLGSQAQSYACTYLAIHYLTPSTCKRSTSKRCMDAVLQAAQFRPCFAQSFPQCNQQLCANTSIETSLSGTTGVTAFLHGGNRLLVANLGDSRCMLGRVNHEGTVTAIPLSSDHSCDVPSEAARIRERKVTTVSYHAVDDSGMWHLQQVTESRQLEDSTL